MAGSAPDRWRVQIAPTAARDLDGIGEPDHARLRRRILSLEDDPRPAGVVKLKDRLHRVRQGDWRILYALDDGIRLVTILRVLRRNERTYRHLA